MLADKIANLREVHIGQASIVRPTGCHHDVIDHWQVSKKTLDGNRIRGVEGRSARCTNLGCSMLKTLGITGGENYLGPFCTCTTCRFESDARAAADHNNGLAKERRFMVDRRGDSYGAHGSSDSASLLLAPLPAVRSYARFMVDAQYSFQAS